MLCCCGDGGSVANCLASVLGEGDEEGGMGGRDLGARSGTCGE